MLMASQPPSVILWQREQPMERLPSSVLRWPQSCTPAGRVRCVVGSRASLQ